MQERRDDNRETTNEKRKVMPSFCSECGEGLKTKQMSMWPSRAYCYHCDPGFGRGRLLFCALLILSLGAGFIVGRYTRRPEPFYFIGTAVEPGSLPVVSSTEKSTQERPSARADLQRGARDTVESICGATTRSGKPCQRKVRGGGFCWQHRAKR